MREAILNLPDDLVAEGFVGFSGMASTLHLARSQTSMDTDPMIAPDPQPEFQISALPLRETKDSVARLEDNTNWTRRH